MTSDWAGKRLPIRVEWLLVFGVALIAACVTSGDDGRAPTGVRSTAGETPDGPTRGCPVDPTHCPPVATGRTYSLSGVVTLRTASGTAPLAGTEVRAFLVTSNGPSYSIGDAITDADGRYQFPGVPEGHVVLWSFPPHAYQRCAAIATVSGANSEKDLELLDSAVTRPVTAADSPTLSGIVYRSTNAGRQPVAGAVIEFEYAPVIATTATTDVQGRYSLCHLPMGRGGLDVWLNGVAVGGAVVNIDGDKVLDFDLSR